MMSKIYSTLICFIFLSGMQYSHAQNSLWQMISENDVQLKVKEIRAAVPDSYELFRLDLNGFKSRLQQAPVRFKATSDIIVVLPGYQGKLQQFRLYEAPLFEQGLQEKYPEIRSYLGQGIDDPSATARISYSPYTGIHAMILSAQYPTVYIDPYTKDKEAYILYDKNNYRRDIDWVCHTEGKGFDAPELRAANANANDGQLRTFRLALACTGEYAQYHLSNQGIPGSATDAVKKAAVLSEMNVAMTRVNGLYERDLAVTMVIVANNTSIIYLNSATDPYTNNDGGTMLSENQTTCDNIIGSSNYDIGHVFSTGGGGVAYLNAPCTTNKARGVTGLGAPIGDAFYIDYVAHEMGHQYGANHTFNSTEGSCGGNRNDATAVEPGSGSTIMSYAGICGSQNVQAHSDDYFQAISIQEMWQNVKTGNSTCAVKSATNNQPPTANGGGNFTIPKSTPFVLTGSSSDPEGDAVTYCWEQMDNEVGTGATQPPLATNTKGPVFRSVLPTVAPKRYFPNIATILTGQTQWTWEVIPSVARTMKFRLTVRDNHAGGGASASDDITITVNGTAGPFKITSQNTATTWQSQNNVTITWDVAGTNNSPINCSNVDIFFSGDGGSTFPILLASSMTNNGTAVVTVPNYNTTQGRVMIKASNNVFFDINDANITIQNSNCTVPTSTAATNITYFSADANWSFATGNFTIEYGPKATFGTPGSGAAAGNAYNTIVTAANVNTKTLTGLSGNTIYSYTVRQNCGANGYSINSNIIDFTTAQAPCLGAEAGSVSIDKAIVCLNSSVILSVVGQSIPAIGLIRTWQASTDGGSTWTDLNNSSDSYPVAVSQTTIYRYYVECTNNNSSDISNLVSVTVKPANTCNYCTNVTFPNGVEPITSVVLNEINNTTNAAVGGTPALEDFINLVANVASGLSYSIQVKGNTGGNYTNKIVVYIDWNQNGIFDDSNGSNEKYLLSDISNSTGTDSKVSTGTIAVPATALPGLTGMRVMKKYVEVAPPCNNTGWGQGEDYTINVIPNNDCSGAISISTDPKTDYINPGIQTAAGTSLSSTPDGTCFTSTTSSKDVWYKITTNGNNNAILNLTVTPASTMDVALTLFSGTCGSLSQVACANGGTTGYSENLVFTLPLWDGDIETRNNTVYYMRVTDIGGTGLTFTINNNNSSALPLTLLSFQAQQVKRGEVLLDWSVKDEVNMKQYDVERSVDGKSFRAIGTVTNLGKETYSLIDPRPVIGINYYRLAMVESNGLTNYSRIAAINVNDGKALHASPNPVTGDLTVEVKGAIGAQAVIDIIDYTGKRVRTLSIPTGKVTVDMSSLPSGVYVVQYLDGTAIYTARVVKI